MRTRTSGFFAAIIALVAMMAAWSAPVAAQVPSNPSEVAAASHCAARAWARHLPSDGSMVVGRRWRDLMFAAGGACTGVDVNRVVAIACTNSWVVGNECAPPPAAPAMPPPERGIRIGGPRPAPRDPCAPPQRCEEVPRPASAPSSAPATPAGDSGVTLSGRRYRVVRRAPSSAPTPPPAPSTPAPAAPPARP